MPFFVEYTRIFSSVKADFEFTFEQYKCTPFTDTTKDNLFEILGLLESQCETDNLQVSTIFEHCLLLNAVRFSYYIAGGSATFEDQLDCEWTDLELTPWKDLEFSDATVANFGKFFGSKGSIFKIATETYTITCTNKESKPAINRANGFISTDQIVIKQSWDRTNYLKVKKDCDEVEGSIRSVEAWEGDVMIGTLQVR